MTLALQAMPLMKSGVKPMKALKILFQSYDMKSQPHIKWGMPSRLKLTVFYPVNPVIRWDDRLEPNQKGSVDQYAVRLRKIILEESSRMVTVNESGQPKEISIAEALMRSVVASALRGEARSQKMAIDLIAAAEASEQKENMELLATVIEYKDSWEKEKKRAERLGLALEVPYPHPDHIHIDTTSGRIEIRGPRHKDDLPRFQWLWEQKQILIQNIRELILEISEDENMDKAKALNKELKSKQTTLQKINFMLGDWKPD